MSQNRPVLRSWLVRTVVLAAIGWFLWSMFGLHVHEPPGPISVETAAALASIPIPPEAKNIRFAGFSHWIQYEQYLRFEAPVEVCLRHAAVIVPGKTLQPADAFQLRPERFPVDKNVFRKFDWFDLGGIGQNVVEAGGGPSEPTVWVDQTRGVFYYRKTD